jgi:hypothetical protein
MILSDAERVTTALGDLLVDTQAPPTADIDEAALAREIEEDFPGLHPVSCENISAEIDAFSIAGK